MIVHPSDTASFDYWVDASHVAEWNTSTAVDDSTTAKSRMGYVVSYAKCLLLCSSKLQTEIALSSTEAEYIALSQAMGALRRSSAQVKQIANAFFFDSFLFRSDTFNYAVIGVKSSIFNHNEYDIYGYVQIKHGQWTSNGSMRR